MKNRSILLLSMAAALPLQVNGALSTFEDYTVGDNLSTPLSGGTGWTGDWVSANATTASGVVSNTSPLGSGNYLEVDLTNTAGGQAMGIGRELAGGAPVGDFSVSFDWRADDLTGFGGSANDRFEFYSSSSAGSVNGAGPGGNNLTSPYLMGVFGASRGVNYTTGGLFGVYNAAATNDGFSGDRYFNLGSVATGGDGTTLTLVEGTTYSVSIDVYAGTQTWDVSVTDGSNTAFSTGLNWWGTDAQPFVGFGARGSDASETRSFSVDNVELVPEPGSSLLALVGMTLLIGRRRR